MQYKQLQILAWKKIQGFNSIQTHGVCVKAAVFYQLSYQDPYVGGQTNSLNVSLPVTGQYKLLDAMLRPQCSWSREYYRVLKGQGAALNSNKT